MEPIPEEKYDTKMEIEEMPDGTWQVRETRIYTYTEPLKAINKMESYIHNKYRKEECLYEDM